MVRRLIDVFEADRKAIQAIGRAARVPVAIHDVLKKRVATAIRRLVELGIVKEVTGKSCDQVFIYDKYVAALADPV